MTEHETKVLGDLEAILEQLVQQNSYRRMFAVGIVYGIGFFIGSAIIATITLGLIGPYIGRIAWVHDAFVTGLQLGGRQ